MVDYRPTMLAKYRLPVIFGQNWPTQQSQGLFATAKLLVLLRNVLEKDANLRQTCRQEAFKLYLRNTILIAIHCAAAKRGGLIQYNTIFVYYELTERSSTRETLYKIQ